MKKYITLMSMVLIVSGCAETPASNRAPITAETRSSITVSQNNNISQTQQPTTQTYSVDEFVESGFKTGKRSRIAVGSVSCYNDSCGVENGGKWGLSMNNKDSKAFFQHAGKAVNMLIEADSGCPVTADQCNKIKNVAIIQEQ